MYDFCEVLALKKVVLVFCAVLLLLPIGLYVAAKQEENAVISISSIGGNPDDYTYVTVSAENNPGIEKCAFTLSYDTSALKYVSSHSGAYGNYSVYDHSGDGELTFAFIDGKDVTGNCDVINLAFKIKADAATGKYDISFKKTYFANESDKEINVKAENGTVEVKKPCAGEHTFAGDRIKMLSVPTCTKDGVRVTACSFCGHIKKETVAAPGHVAGKEFSVSYVSKDGKAIVISQTCKTCGERVNVIVNDSSGMKPVNTDDLNRLAKTFGDTSVSNLVYFLNGSKTYPDIPKDADDSYMEKYIKGEIKAINGTAAVEEKSLRNANGTVNVDVAVDRLLRTFFGEDKKSGIIGELKKAEVANELPVRLIKKLLSFGIG